MGFRTVVVKSRSKLECRLNYLVVRSDVEQKVFLNEINTLIVQSTAVSLTAALLAELARNNVKVIFCDEKGNPSSELLPYYGAHNVSKRIREQFAWSDEVKGMVWSKIVRQKIVGQARHLADKGLPGSELLLSYADRVESGDASNREGHAAKVYFNSLFGKGFSRDDPCFENACLNYGYAVLLSAFNREIVAAGYLTQLGIWHENQFNQFNFACDLMEPFRPFVDRIATSMPPYAKDFKKRMTMILSCEVAIDGKNTLLENALKVYCRSVFDALQTGDVQAIRFVESFALPNFE